MVSADVGRRVHMVNGVLAFIIVAGLVSAVLGAKAHTSLFAVSIICLFCAGYIIWIKLEDWYYGRVRHTRSGLGEHDYK